MEEHDGLTTMEGRRAVILARARAALDARRASPAPAGADVLPDAAAHFDCLLQAVAGNAPSLFTDHLAWTKVVLARRGTPASALELSLECLGEALAAELPREVATRPLEILTLGRARLPQLADDIARGIAEQESLAPLARAYLEDLLAGERHRAARRVLDAAESGTPVKDLYLHVFERCLHEIGALWQSNQISVAQEHYCTAATQMVMSQLYPRIFTGRRSGLRFVATCVGGDLHEIGVRMVADLLEMDGWDTYYLGASTPTESVVRTVAERQPHVLGISATMTAHLGKVRELIAAVRAADVPLRPVVLVGGHPFQIAPDLWRSVGADGTAASAASAAAVARELLAPEAA